MNEKSELTRPPVVSQERIVRVIHVIRGHKVILDADLAAIYGVSTKALNQAIKRNHKRFPDDFVLHLTPPEVHDLTSQSAISSLQPADRQTDGRSKSPMTILKHGGMRSQSVTASDKRNIRFLPYAFTEHGAVMAANILRSERAVQMSVFVVRAFVRMRAALGDTQELARKLAALEREVKARLDTHDAAIVDVLRRIMDIIDPPSAPYPDPRKIGFGVKERRATYRVGRRT